MLRKSVKAIWSIALRNPINMKLNFDGQVYTVNQGLAHLIIPGDCVCVCVWVCVCLCEWASQFVCLDMSESGFECVSQHAYVCEKSSYRD